ncbi:hypothetical protein Nepgr_018065 [Nepenthes gracilis]|uniref:Uncharacterized protein n=1 Tax=Nepenthes gracilis TaxID=150966 RepID=A0AAD3SSS2_NEPGR|nr:hypothetical protein Nepgr_018065 [Nepenthes gracilis]
MGWSLGTDGIRIAITTEATRIGLAITSKEDLENAKGEEENGPSSDPKEMSLKARIHMLSNTPLRGGCHVLLFFWPGSRFSIALLQSTFLVTSTMSSSSGSSLMGLANFSYHSVLALVQPTAKISNSAIVPPRASVSCRPMVLPSTLSSVQAPPN